MHYAVDKGACVILFYSVFTVDSEIYGSNEVL